MNFWIVFWTVVFFASLAIFATLSVVVVVGGFFNIKSLLKGLKSRAGQDNDSSCEIDDQVG